MYTCLRISRFFEQAKLSKGTYIDAVHEAVHRDYASLSSTVLTDTKSVHTRKLSHFARFQVKLVIDAFSIHPVFRIVRQQKC